MEGGNKVTRKDLGDFLAFVTYYARESLRLLEPRVVTTRCEIHTRPFFLVHARSRVFQIFEKVFFVFCGSATLITRYFSRPPPPPKQAEEKETHAITFKNHHLGAESHVLYCCSAPGRSPYEGKKKKDSRGSENESSAVAARINSALDFFFKGCRNFFARYFSKKRGLFFFSSRRPRED